MTESLRLSSILELSSYRKGIPSGRADSTSIPSDTLSAGFKFKRKGTGEYIIPSSSPVDFSKYSSDHLEELWSRYSSTDYDDESLSYTDPDLAYEVKKCKYALDFWEMTPGPKRYSKAEILRSTLLIGPTYSETLSDEWNYGIRRSHRVSGMFNDYTRWKPIVHYNELPPIGYLIRWKEISTDIEYMKLPLKPFDKDLMAELKEEILDSLPDELELPTDIEIFSEVKTSTTLDLDKMKTIPFYLGRLTPEGSSFSRIFKAKRSIVPVGPANTRDAVVTTIDTYNSVKRNDLIMGTLLDPIEESLVNSSSQVFNKRLKRASRTPPIFGKQMYWLRDIKKCGLTFPRELLLLLQECLSEKYPDKDFSTFDIYRNYSVYDEDNKPIKTERGYCLGMANNSITYIQCMIYRMLERRIPESISLEAYFGNDDSIVKINSADESVFIDEADAMMVQIIDFEILDGLNIITNDEKSFWSWYPIIFEEYGKEEFKEKDSRLACALSSAMLAPDIKYAKLLTSSLSLAFWGKGSWISLALDAITSHWGFEYYPEEVNYDYSLGGWISLKSKGCSLALRNIESAPDELLPFMWKAYNEYYSFKKKVIRPILKGTVTKNYSVTGSILNITFVDSDLYDVPELPIEMIYLDREGFTKFYESIYRFNRNPYKIMASRLRDVVKSSPKIDIQKRSIIEVMMSDDSVTYAIPESMVFRSTSIFEIDENGSTDCNSLRRNCLSRYIQYLKEENLLMCTDMKIEPSGEYPFVQSFDGTPFTEEVNVVTALNGEVDLESIYQFTTNPWLVLSEYVKEYDRLPLLVERVVESRKHLPIWFMTKPYRNSREISICYNLIEYGEEFTDSILEEIRKIERDKEPPPDENRREDVPQCNQHRAGYCPWDATDDIYSWVEEDCMLCIMEHQLWGARKRSQTEDSIEKRRDAYRLIAPLRTRIKYLIEKFCPLLIPSLNLCLQDDVGNDIFAAIVDDDDEEGMFADLGF
jgi:hypothetical protein